jgi:hypothetical protein
MRKTQWGKIVIVCVFIIVCVVSGTGCDIKATGGSSTGQISDSQIIESSKSLKILTSEDTDTLEHYCIRYLSNIETLQTGGNGVTDADRQAALTEMNTNKATIKSKYYGYDISTISDVYLQGFVSDMLDMNTAYSNTVSAQPLKEFFYGDLVTLRNYYDRYLSDNKTLQTVGSGVTDADRQAATNEINTIEATIKLRCVGCDLFAISDLNLQGFVASILGLNQD